MLANLRGTLRQALGKLEAEKARIERQITGLKQALKAGIGSGRDAAVRDAGATARRGRRMSPAARKAVSARMKAYWAKRRGARPKGKNKVA
jgi:hypothetical protein